MRYRLRTLAESSMVPVAATLNLAHRVLTHQRNPLQETRFVRRRAAGIESVVRLIKPYPKQRFNYEPIVIDGKQIAIDESVVLEKPFCQLRRFSHAGTKGAPKLLFVAAMSGHHATLSKDTLREFLPDFDVYITDWVDARLVPPAAGSFGLDDYTNYLIDFLDALGGDVHLVGLCQAAVPALSAAAIMAEDKHPARPRTLTLVAGPIDIRANASKVTRNMKYMRSALMRLNIHRVPKRYPGAGRLVYPGYLQLMGFVSLNLRNHMSKHLQFYRDVASGRHQDAERHRVFYDEYNAMMDVSAEFYLETLDRVFFDQHLAKGKMQYRGRTVNCAAIQDIPLLTLEGADDDMVAPGVTAAAQTLCVSLSDAQREHKLQEGVGHYGIFNGSIYKEKVAPRMKKFMLRHGKTARA